MPTMENEGYKSLRLKHGAWKKLQHLRAEQEMPAGSIVERLIDEETARATKRQKDDARRVK